MIFTIATVLLTATNSTFSQNAVETIHRKVQQIEVSDSLKRMDFDASEIYEQAFDGGGEIEIYQISHELVQAKETMGLSIGRVTTTVFFDNQEPVMIREVEEMFPWDDSKSGLDYTQLDSTFEKTMYLKSGQVLKVEHIGQKNISGRTDKISEYESTIERMKQLANQKRKQIITYGQPIEKQV